MAARPLSQLLADLANAFPRQAVTPATVAVYARELDDLPEDALEQAVRDLIRSADWLPTVAAIRLAAAEYLLELPSETDALSQIEARIAWARADDGTDPPPVHNLVSATLEHVGGYHAFRSTDKPSMLRAQFVNLYRETRQRQLRDVQTGKLLGPGGQQVLGRGTAD